MDGFNGTPLLQWSRSHDDERQIQCWAACASMRGRWRNQLCGAIAKVSKHADDVGQPSDRQTLLHWAYELTNADFDEEGQENVTR